jgi:hypothetical protein
MRNCLKPAEFMVSSNLSGTLELLNGSKIKGEKAFNDGRVPGKI